MWTSLLIVLTLHGVLGHMGTASQNRDEDWHTCDASPDTNCKKALGTFSHAVVDEDEDFVINASAHWHLEDEDFLDFENIQSVTDTEIRLVLVGRTGEGKSSTANTIIGKKHFKAKTMGKSVTKYADFVKENVQGRELLLVDTPGLFDTDKRNNETLLEITKSLLLSSPGPHAFLLVFSTQRVTDEIKKSMELLRTAFGDEMLRHSILVFTRKDDLDDDGTTIEEFLKDVPSCMQELVEACDHRYVAFNNKLKGAENNKQVGMLLEKLDDLLESNGGKCFLSEQYDVIEAKIKEMDKKERQAIEDEWKKKSAPMKEKIREMEQTMNKMEEEQKQDNEEQIRRRNILEDQLKKEKKRYAEEKRNAEEKAKKIRDNSRQEVKDESCVSCIVGAGLVGALVVGVGTSGTVGATVAAGTGLVVGSAFYFVAGLFS